MISGDSHHYARYRSDTGREKITAGGGGAFLSATHALENEVDVPTAPDGELSRHELKRCYPDAATSRRLSLAGAGAAVPEPVVHVGSWDPRTCCCSWPTSSGCGACRPDRRTSRRPPRNWSWLDLALGRLRNPLTLVVILTLFALLTGFAKPPASIRARWAKLATRAGNGRLPHHPPTRHGGDGRVGRDSHASSSRTGSRTSSSSSCSSRSWEPSAAPIALGLYLVLALTLLGTHQTEVFSAIREEGYKNFLRLHIAPDGSLTVYALGIDRVVKDWDLDPDNPDNEASYLKPRGDDVGRRPTDRPDIVRSEFGVGRRVGGVGSRACAGMREPWT